MRAGRRLGAVGVGTALAILAVGGAIAANSTVRIQDFTFTPGTVTVAVGDTVTWQNDDTNGHTATSDGNFDTGAIAPGADAAVTFDTAGTFGYICTIHPNMTGTVVVEAGSDAAGLTPAPTDTAPMADEPATDPTAAVAFLLAVLGVAMLGGTLVMDRRRGPATVKTDDMDRR
jgi:plastocyanin